MKKLQQYFNAMSVARQKKCVILFTIAFALLLAVSLGYNKVIIKPGYVPVHIGRTSDSLNVKK